MGLLRNVLADYLDRIPTERAFDVPFQALLGAMGFYDIHVTHGRNEMGKDFIAKRVDGGVATQWSFQSKKGDISLPAWRKELVPQMLTCEMTGLHHPNFDTTLPRQSVLVATGVLAEHVNTEIASFSQDTLVLSGKKPIEVWSRPVLIDMFIDHGLGAVQGSLMENGTRLGPFYTLYGRAISSELVLEDLEKYSREWLGEGSKAEELLLAGCVEASILAGQCRTTMGLYEALYAELAALRTICHHWFHNTDSAREAYFREIHQAQLTQVKFTCREFLDQVCAARASSMNRLDYAISSAAAIVTYPVLCSRSVEAAALVYFIETDPDEKATAIEFIKEMVEDEPGTLHPISDRYAVSLVLAGLALIDANRELAVTKLLTNATIFVCDRYSDGFGLASVDATVDDELQQLLGYPFDCFKLNKMSASFLAAAIGDVAAFSGIKSVYEDIINDFKACRVIPHYWQCFDTAGQFRIEGEDVIHYSATEFEDTAVSFEAYDHAQHIRKEPRAFRHSDSRGLASFLCLSAFLRDRYFPSQWAKNSPPERAAIALT